ncbi:MAG: alpha/beta fold hydrolase [Pseudomonadota bacterium]|nr:alpha/beta fold hydrolase [Pseudomonadota bacterium]
MYHLSDFGSFHVGGRIVEVRDQPNRKVWFTETSYHDQDPNGEFLIEQVYVQYFIPQKRQYKWPLVLLHGGGLTGACWETTPDGRPGWLHNFLSAGFAVYVLDNVERGRSGFCAIENVWDGQPIQRTLKEAWDIFRFGKPENYESGKPFKGLEFPLEYMEAFQRQFVPRWTSTSGAQVRGIGEALKKIGSCVLICHSQGGFLGGKAAVENIDVIKGLICVETSGWPRLTDINKDIAKKAPWLVLLGDYIDESPRWRSARTEAAEFCEHMNSLGGNASLISLPDVGFKGASHMLMMDRHSDKIAGWISKWILRSCVE